MKTATANAPQQQMPMHAALPANTGEQSAVEQKKVKPIDSVRATLEKMKPQLEMALPQHVGLDRLLRVAVTAIQQTPALLDCDRTSLYAAIMTSAQLGLEPDGVLGQAYLVPFSGRVQFIVGYKGLLQLARNSGEVESIAARTVHANDRFTYAYGLEEKLDHVPATGDRGPVVYVYAVAKLKSGGHHFEVLSVGEVEKVRQRAPGGNSPAWKNHFEEMAKKTAIRRLAKFLPLSVQKAAAIEEQYELGRHAGVNTHGDVVIEGEVSEPTPTPTSQLDSFANGGEQEETQTERQPGEDD